jgi:hypothetical protein
MEIGREEKARGEGESGRKVGAGPRFGALNQLKASDWHSHKSSEEA